MKDNLTENKFYWVYLAGIFIILFLPAFFTPTLFFPVDWGRSLMFRSILAVLIFFFLAEILWQKSNLSEKLKFLKKSKIFWALAGLFIIFLLASIFSVDPRFSFWGSPWRGGGFVNFGFFIIFSVFLFLTLKNSDWRKAMDFSIIIGILVALLSVIQFYGLLSNIFVPVPERPSSTAGNPIMLATYLLMLFLLTVSLIFKEKIFWKKIFYIATLLLFLLAIMIAQSRAAYFGLLIGAIYFFFFYPKKMLILKAGFGLILFLVFLSFIFVNTNAQFSGFLSKNKVLDRVIHRISFAQAIDHNRVAAWKVGIKAAIERPILGYGPENFAVGFDKFYDPTIPYLGSEWWDRQHNVFIETAVVAGIPALAIYLLFFVVLFWQLHKVKHAENNTDINAEKILMAHGLQAIFIAYLAAIFFSFDDFSTYLICFLLVGYSLSLIYNCAQEVEQDEIQKTAEHKNILWKYVLASVSLCVLILFLWQYNLVPLQINGQINKTRQLVNQKNCTDGLSLIDKILSSHTFLDSYIRMQYIDLEDNCSVYYPEKIITYTKKGYELMDEAVKLQPTYTRFWTSLGNFAITLASLENNPKAKADMIRQGNYYFDRALELAPKRQKIIIGKARMSIVAGDYKSAENYSQKCVALDSNIGECYWYLAIAEIYMKNTVDADKNIQMASNKEYNINSPTALAELVDAYYNIPDYKNLAAVFEKLVALNPNTAQYHSSLAFCYFKIGEYKKARQQALLVLQISPESKPNVDAFLKTLPY